MGFDEYKKQQGATKTTFWTSKTRRVDLETGEEITKYNAKRNYIKIKTEKHVKRTTTTGHIEYIIGYRKSTQCRINYDNA